MKSQEYDIDLGFNHYLKFTSWNLDRDLNPQYNHLPDIKRVGAIIYHSNNECSSHVFFDSEVTRQLWPDHSKWKLESENPLTLHPSILCLSCGDHGFIKKKENGLKHEEKFNS